MEELEQRINYAFENVARLTRACDEPIPDDTSWPLEARKAALEVAQTYLDGLLAQQAETTHLKEDHNGTNADD